MNSDKTALIALRVSTSEQLKNTSIESQRERCIAYAEQHGFHIPPDGIAIDDESGATLSRTNFSVILRRLRAGEAKHLIVFVLDRLTREPADFLPLRKELHALGVTIHIAREDREISKDPLDDLPDDIKVVIGKHERAVFRDRSIAGRKKKIARGALPGNGPPPYGFRYVGHKSERQLVINDDEAEIAKLMARWFIFGDGDRPPLSILEISRRLTEMRIPTRADTLGRAKKLRGRGEWDYRAVAGILRDSALGGIFYANRIQRLSKKEVRLRPREEWIPIPIPAILEADLFAAVQRKIDQGRALATRNNTKRWYLFRCRIRCACGYAVCGWGTPKSPIRYYRCNRRNVDRPACGLPYIPVDLLDARVWHWIEHEALDDAQLQARIEREQARASSEPGADIAARRADLDAKLRANAAQEQQLLDEMLRGRFSQAAIDAKLAQLAAERRDLERRHAAIGTAPVRPMLSDPAARDLRTYAAIIREGLTDMSPQEQRRAIDMLDARLELYQQNGNIVAKATCILRLDAARLLIDARTRTG